LRTGFAVVHWLAVPLRCCILVAIDIPPLAIYVHIITDN
jgi:hypothetical protein